METIINELKNSQNVRNNLSKLRQLVRDSKEQELSLEELEHNNWILPFLKSEDAKTRKNAALLLGELECENAKTALWKAYQREQTLFVKSAYLNALSHLDVEEFVPELKEELSALMTGEILPENQKHVNEQVRELRKILIQYEGITHHTFSARNQTCEVLLLCNREQKGAIIHTITDGRAKLHPLGILVETSQLSAVMQNRLYRELVFPIHAGGLLPADAKSAAQKLWNSDMYELLERLHKESGDFYFRIECKSPMTLEERSAFSKKLSSELERLSAGKLINSTSDYEIELRLIATKDGCFYPCMKLYTMKNKRFAYRKNAIAASIHPSTAALIAELARPYLKENAQIMDPFCGVGTMLIERDLCVPAREIYATDIFGEAIEKGRENARLAGEKINFIHRDFFDFKHEYPFDEIITNMPLRGKKTKEETDQFYADFFTKLPEILAKDAVIILYTNEIGFVKKQLRIHRNFCLLQEYCMQKKNEFYLMIIGTK